MDIDKNCSCRSISADVDHTELGLHCLAAITADYGERGRSHNPSESRPPTSRISGAKTSR
jgi:hypothetical protein